MGEGPGKDPSCSINLCLFCYKPTSFSTTTKSGKSGLECSLGQDANSAGIVNKFLKLLERFFDDKIFGNNCFGELLDNIESPVGRIDCCQDCKCTVETFCDKLHKWRCLELELEWKLKTLVDIMRVASRVPSRMQMLKSIFEQDGDGTFEDSRTRLKTLKTFKHDLVNKCTLRLSKSQPRVLVKRICSAKCPLGGPTLYSNSDDPAAKLDPVGPAAVTQLLQRIISFTVVVMLYFTTIHAGKNSPALSSNDVDKEHTRNCFLLSELEQDFLVQDDILERDGTFPHAEMDTTIGTTTSPESRPQEGYDEDALDQQSLNSPVETDFEHLADDVVPPANQNIVEDTMTVVPQHDHEGVSSKNVFACSQCSKTFVVKQSLHAHMTRVHPKAVKTRYYCDICDMYFRNSGLLRRHKFTSRSHNTLRKVLMKKQNKIKKESCDVTEIDNGANETFSILEETADEAPPANSHVDTKEETLPSDGDESELENKLQVDNKAVVDKPKREVVRCYLPECYGRRMVRKNLYEDHKTFHASGQYQCNFCPVIETNVLRLSTHERLQHPDPQPGSSGAERKPFHCPRCKYETSKEFSYQWHFAKIHIPGFEQVTSRNVVECEICHKRIDKRNINRHAKICRLNIVKKVPMKKGRPRKKIQEHGLEKDFACTICSKTLASQYSLERHRILVHLDKRFHCAICNKYFGRYELLRKHKMRSHVHIRRKRKKSRKAAIDESSGEYSCEMETLSTTVESETTAAPTNTGGGYSLRNKGKRCYKIYAADDDDGEEGNADSAGSDFNSDGSSETSSSYDSDESEVDMKPELDVVKRASKVGPLALRCPEEECRGRRVMKREYYEDHKKLHVACEYKCNFCPVIATNIFRLCRHEMRNHSNSQQISDNNQKTMFHCPRCDYESQMEYAYERHFAESHIPGFESSWSSFVQCDICHKKVKSHQKERHDKIYHNTTENHSQHIRKLSQDDANKKRILCTICSKSCASKQSLAQHRIKMHSDVCKTKFYCQICNVYLANYYQLRAHKLSSGRHKEKAKLLRRRQESTNEAVTISSEKGKGVNITGSTSIKVEKVAEDVEEESEGHQANKPEVVKDRPAPAIFWCSLDGCDGTLRRNMYKYEDHQKLHVPGQYKCKFCPVIETNIVKLSRHERNKHSKVQQSGSRGDLKLFHCPRCDYEVTSEICYEWHFAKNHIPGFEARQTYAKVDCDICGVAFAEIKKDLHYANWHDTTGVDAQKIRKCDVEGCSAYFTNKTLSQLYLHKRKVHSSISAVDIPDDSTEDDDDNAAEENSLQCKLCNKTFKKLANLHYHKRIYHNRNPDRISGHVTTNQNALLICPYVNCARSFKTVQLVENHQKMHGSFKCQFCEVTKDYAPDLPLHEIEHMEVTGNVEGNACSKSGPEKHLQCSRCAKSFEANGKRTFIKHFIQDHLDLWSGAFSTCPICQAEVPHIGKQSKSTGYMRNHFNTHHNTNRKGVDPSKILRCDLCPAYFLINRQLIIHKISVHFKGKCPVCDKTFTRARHYTLPRHMAKAHPEENAFKDIKFCCDIKHCRSTFSTQAELDTHKKECNKDNGFQCTKCGKDFKGKTYLNSHIRIVHSEETHVCPQCGRAFKNKFYLTNHMVYHEGPDSWKFQCSTCSRKFPSNDKLQQHMRTHTKEKPFICQFCGERYAHRHNWRHHMTSKHKDEYVEVEDRRGTTKGKKICGISRKGSKKGDYLLAGTRRK